MKYVLLALTESFFPHYSICLCVLFCVCPSAFPALRTNTRNIRDIHWPHSTRCYPKSSAVVQPIHSPDRQRIHELLREFCAIHRYDIVLEPQPHFVDFPVQLSIGNISLIVPPVTQPFANTPALTLSRIDFNCTP